MRRFFYCFCFPLTQNHIRSRIDTQVICTEIKTAPSQPIPEKCENFHADVRRSNFPHTKHTNQLTIPSSSSPFNTRKKDSATLPRNSSGPSDVHPPYRKEARSHLPTRCRGMQGSEDTRERENPVLCFSTPAAQTVVVSVHQRRTTATAVARSTERRHFGTTARRQCTDTTGYGTEILLNGVFALASMDSRSSTVSRGTRLSHSRFCVWGAD